MATSDWRIVCGGLGSSRFRVAFWNRSVRLEGTEFGLMISLENSREWKKDKLFFFPRRLVTSIPALVHIFERN